MPITMDPASSPLYVGIVPANAVHIGANAMPALRVKL
jgi:hypothetical protein